MLSYRTGSPLLFAKVTRDKGKYQIHYSDPVWPNCNEPMEKEIARLMHTMLSYLEESIKEKPGEWMWLHNRFKQQTPDLIKRSFRQESICMVLPEDKVLFDSLLPHLPTLRKIYRLEFFTLFVPKQYQEALAFDGEIIPYDKIDEVLVRDFRFKLVFNFHGDKRISKHFLSHSAFFAPTLADFMKEAGMTSLEKMDFSSLFERAILHAK